MKKRSIYQQLSQRLLRIYEAAGNARKVLLGAIDYAKKNRVMMLCNGDGDILRTPFTLHNTPEGIEYLGTQVRQASRDTNSYPVSGHELLRTCPSVLR